MKNCFKASPRSTQVALVETLAGLLEGFIIQLRTQITDFQTDGVHIDFATAFDSVVLSTFAKNLRSLGITEYTEIAGLLLK